MLRWVVAGNRLWRMIDVNRLGRVVGSQRLRGIVGVYRLRRMVDILWRVVSSVLWLIGVVLDLVVVVIGGVGRGRTVDRREESGND